MGNVKRLYSVAAAECAICFDMWAMREAVFNILMCLCFDRWAMQEGYGACLLKKPELLSDMVGAVRSRLSNNPDFTVSIKIRLHDNVK